MATGLEVYDAIKRATAGMPAGSCLVVHQQEAMDLRKLTPEQLVGRGFNLTTAEEVCADLERHALISDSDRKIQDEGVAAMGPSMNLKMTVSPSAKCLTDPRPN